MAVESELLSSQVTFEFTIEKGDYCRTAPEQTRLAKRITKELQELADTFLSEDEKVCLPTIAPFTVTVTDERRHIAKSMQHAPTLGDLSVYWHHEKSDKKTSADKSLTIIRNIPGERRDPHRMVFHASAGEHLETEGAHIEISPEFGRVNRTKLYIFFDKQGVGTFQLGGESQLIAKQEIEELFPWLEVDGLATEGPSQYKEMVVRKVRDMLFKNV